MAPTKGFRGMANTGRTAALAAAAVLLSGCDYLRPFEQVCERRLAPASIQVSAPATQIRHDFSQSTAALTARGANSHALAAGAGRVVEGLTEVQLKRSVSISGSGIVKPLSGRYCTRPGVQVTLAYQPMTVLVSSAHQPGGCEHALTLNHEMKHVRAYERYMDELSAEIEAGLQELLGDGIHYFNSAAEGERALDTKINKKISAIVSAGMIRVQQRQRDIDTPEEYGRLDLMQSKCGS